SVGKRARPGRATRFPYTTLFRSQTRDGVQLFVDASCLRGPLGGSCLGGLDTPDATDGHGGVVQVPLPDGVAVPAQGFDRVGDLRSEEHTSELQSRENLVCRLLLE